MHGVAIWVYEGLSPFELGVAVEIFGLPRPELPLDYEVAVCAGRPGTLAVLGGFWMTVQHGLEALAAADTVIVPGCPDVSQDPPAEVVAAVRAAYDRGARVASFCSGAFVLAAAGLLDGRRATTHWRYASTLARRHPRVRVDPEVLYVDEGRVLTSAGTAAGIDLCLHLVRTDHGVAVANAVARRVVVPAHREGGQAQYIESPAVEPTVDGPLRLLLERLARDPLGAGDVAQLAASVHMSERTFARRFKAVTGTSPVRWLTAVRVGRARELLETTDEPVDRIATAAGFGSVENLRLHFRRATSTSPAAYRRAFR